MDDECIVCARSLMKGKTSTEEKDPYTNKRLIIKICDITNIDYGSGYLCSRCFYILSSIQSLESDFMRIVANKKQSDENPVHSKKDLNGFIRLNDKIVIKREIQEEYAKTSPEENFQKESPESSLNQEIFEDKDARTTPEKNIENESSLNQEIFKQKEDEVLTNEDDTFFDIFLE